MAVATKTVQMKVWQLTENYDGTVDAGLRPTATNNNDPAVVGPAGGETRVRYDTVAESPKLDQLIDVTYAPASTV